MASSLLITHYPLYCQNPAAPFPGHTLLCPSLGQFTPISGIFRCCLANPFRQRGHSLGERTKVCPLKHL